MTQEELIKLASKPTLYIKNNFNALYLDINNFCNINKISCDNFKQKMYHFTFDIKTLPTCTVCNRNTPKFNSFNKGYNKYCSCKCRANDAILSEKIKQNNLNKYGVENVSQIQEVKDKVKKTCLSKYNTSYPFNSLKSKETCLNKYNVDNVSKLKVTKNKISTSIIASNNKNGYDIKIKRKETVFERYGVDNPVYLVKHKNYSKLEEQMKTIFDISSITLEHFTFDLYFHSNNTIVEIDGYFHPKVFKNIKYYQINHAINDYVKEQIVMKYNYKFYRIDWKILNDAMKVNNVTLDFIVNNHYEIDRTFNKFSDIISTYEIVKCRNKCNHRKFTYLMIRLMYLYQLMMNRKYNSLSSFLSSEFNIVDTK